MSAKQMTLFPEVADAFLAAGGPLTNEQLYHRVAQAAGLSADALHERHPVGQAGQPRNLVRREIRWHQQTLKAMGVIERVDRGVWQLSERIQRKEGDLHRVLPGIKLVAFSTELGVAIWSRSADVFPLQGEEISLCVTSPPYPLRTERAYGNPEAADYSDFICRSLEPIVRNLTPGGSIVLNVSNDIFEPSSPARSMYVERMLISLHDRLGLHLMDRLPWVNYSKPPGPTYWACRQRVQLSAAYEPIYWLTNDPLRVRADNRRVLAAHTQRHQALMAAGGEGRVASYGDGAYQLRPHSFGRVTPGKIPRNVIERGHRCADTQAYRRAAQAAGLPTHGAVFPTDLPSFFIKLLTEPGELVVDLFGGIGKSGLAAERLGRRWLISEWIREYLAGGSFLFRDFAGYHAGPALSFA